VLRQVLGGWLQGIALAELYIGIGFVVDRVARGETVGAGWFWGLGALILLAGLAAMVGPWLGANDQARLEHSYRRDAVAKVFGLGVVMRTRERTGQLVSTATDGVERASGYRATFIGPMIGSMTLPIIVLLLVGTQIDWGIAWRLAVAIPAIPVGLGAFQMMFRNVSNEYRANARKLSAQFLDAIQGLPTLSGFNAENRMGNRLADAAESLRRHVMKLLAGNQLMLFVVDSLFSLAFVAGSIWLALDRYNSGIIGLGEALALVLIATLLLEPLDRIGQFFYVAMGGIAAAKELKVLQAEEPAVSDAPEAVFPEEIDPDAPAIELREVSFHYSPTSETEPDIPPEVLNRVNLQVKPGEHVVLTGPSGAGKTTIATLIQADARPESGEVRLGGYDLTEVKHAWVRAQLSVVAQSSYLFTGTLRENLLIAKPEASDAELLEALAAADLSEFVAGLPDGLDSQVGERGLAMSGGQTQRVALARAFLKNAPVLILDEPTSQVDLESERAILASLDELGAGRTVLAISHRQATINDADRIVRLEAGVLA
jgi:ABC-type transport system involved in cytochrome bd biosynthesis fused ATPase/permease subunit